MVGMNVVSGGLLRLRETRNELCRKVPQPFLLNINRGIRHDGSRRLIPMFDSPHRNVSSLHPAAVLILELVVAVWEDENSSWGP